MSAGKAATFFSSALTPKRLAIFEACIIGLAAGLAGVAVKHGVGFLGTLRLELAQQLPYLLGLPLFGLVGGLAAGWLVERVAPETTGSGIPQVKEVLHKVPIKFDLRVAFIKLVGGILALGSGLPLGREGPTVQVGAALAAQLERWLPTSPEHRRNLIAAGAGAGLAAAFNAPIAGIIFVAEELLKDISSFTLGWAILACFVAAIISQGGGGPAFDISLEHGLPPTGFTVAEIPFFVLLGVAAGTLGALFNNGIIASLNLNFRRSGLSITWRVGLAGLVTGLLVGLLPVAYHNNAALRHLLVNAEADWQIAVVAFALQFLLTLLAYGSGAPGGLFAPSLMLGAALGYLTGTLSNGVLGTGNTTTFVLAGMGAFFSGAIRVPITAIVIVFEMTGDFNIVLPLMVACAVSWLVGEKIAPGALYDRLVEWSGVKLKESGAAIAHREDRTAADVMKEHRGSLDQGATIDEVLNEMTRTRQKGFPILHEGKLAGIVTESDLALVFERALPGSASVAEIMTVNPVTVAPEEPIINVLRILNSRDISFLPVVKDDRLVGTIMLHDLVRAELEQVAQAEAEETGPEPAD